MKLTFFSFEKTNDIYFFYIVVNQKEKNKKAARDSRYRKKLYIDLLEKKLEE